MTTNAIRIRPYIIRRTPDGFAVYDRDTGERLAAYRDYRDPHTGRTVDGSRAMRKELDQHLENGGTLGNYQW